MPPATKIKAIVPITAKLFMTLGRACTSKLPIVFDTLRFLVLRLISLKPSSSIRTIRATTP